MTRIHVTHEQYRRMWNNFLDYIDPTNVLYGDDFFGAVDNALANMGGQRISSDGFYTNIIVDFDRDADATMFVLKWS